MIKVNEYFNGNVKSMAIKAGDFNATVGVMLPGEYEFGTSTEEKMVVTEGQIDAMLPGENDWKSFKAGQEFHVPANVKFQVRIKNDTSYICYYK